MNSKSKNKVTIIAEAGVNHNGNIKIAEKMVKAASKLGVDFIKFQAFFSENLSTDYAKKPNYVKTNIKESQLKMLKRMELTKIELKKLKKLCKKNKIGFLASAFDIDSLNFLKSINLKIFKIPSGEINNLPYLRHVGKFKKKIILSTGMSNIKEIRKALKELILNGTNKKNISLLQCNTDYPSKFKDLNLKVIKKFKRLFKINVGLSDHSPGIEASIAAVGMGAKVIEKHFTLNKNYEGPDHKASLSLDELKKLVKSIRNIELAFGSENKKVSPSEKKNIKLVRKSIVAKEHIHQGEFFTIKNITTKRPGTGKSPIFWDKILGKKSKRNYSRNEQIK